MFANSQVIWQSVPIQAGNSVRYVAKADKKNDLFDAGKNARDHLQEGSNYTVKLTYNYDEYTFVELFEHPGILFYSHDFVNV